MTRNPRFRSVAERNLDQWALWLGLLAALLVLTLAGCSAGTRLTTSGTICGQPLSWPWPTERTARGSPPKSRALTAAAS